MSFDDELRSALRREEPSVDFAERVVARIAAGRRPVLWLPRFRWAAAAMAACLGIVAAGLEYRRQQHVRAEGEAAKARVMLALRIAGNKVHMAQKKIQELNE
jgi:hypothetical protein